MIHPNDLMWLEIWDSSPLSPAIIPRLSMNFFSLRLYTSIFNAFGLIDCCKLRKFNWFWVSWPPTSYFMLGYIRKFNQANDVRHVIIRSTSWKKNHKRTHHHHRHLYSITIIIIIVLIIPALACHLSDWSKHCLS